MYILISSLVNDAFEVLNGEDIDLLLTFKTVNAKSTPVGYWSNAKSPQR